MRRFLLIAVIVTSLIALPSLANEPQSSDMPGYSAANAQTERDWEAKFRDLPQPAAMRHYMQRLAARPHHVGSPYDKDNAEWLMATFKSWGLDSHIENFYVLFPTPKERVVEMLEPTRFVAKLQEPA